MIQFFQDLDERSQMLHMHMQVAWLFISPLFFSCFYIFYNVSCHVLQCTFTEVKTGHIYKLDVIYLNVYVMLLSHVYEYVPLFVQTNINKSEN